MQGAIIQLHTQRSSPKDGPQQLHVLESAASKDNKLTLASIARLAVTWTGNTAAAAASHPLLRPAVGMLPSFCASTASGISICTLIQCTGLRLMLLHC